MTPHVCPKCQGEREVPSPLTNPKRLCPVYLGAGVLWEPAIPIVSVVPPPEPTTPLTTASTDTKPIPIIFPDRVYDPCLGWTECKKP